MEWKGGRSMDVWRIRQTKNVSFSRFRQFFFGLLLKNRPRNNAPKNVNFWGENYLNIEKEEKIGSKILQVY